MAWSATAKANVASGTDATSYATGSWTPTADRLVLAWVANDKAAAPDTPTLSGNGLTWTQVGTDNSGLGAIRETLFVAKTGAAPSAGAVTADFAGATQTGCIILVVEVDGADLSGTALAAVAQFKFAASASNATSGSATLDAAPDAANRCFSFWVHVASEASTPRASWTELQDVNHPAPSRGGESQWRSDAAEQTGSASWTSSVPWAGVIAEVKAAGAGTVAGSQATETDTANAGTPAAAIGGTQAVETDTPNAGSPTAQVNGTQANEVDTANAGAPLVTIQGSQAVESDTAAGGTPAVAVAGSQAGEADTANAGAAAVTVAGSQAVEIDSAFAGLVDLSWLGEQAVETDTAFAGVAVGGLEPPDDRRGCAAAAPSSRRGGPPAAPSSRRGCP